ncbi:MAG: Crp/Fnr family transcriptional regulator [Armatimonadota bacterium]
MPKASTISAIRACPIFESLNEAMLLEIAELARPKAFAARETIFSEGDSCNGFYLVVSGMVKVYKLSGDGKEHVLHLLGGGETFAEAAIFLGSSFLAHSEAIKASDVILFPKEPFLNLLHRQPEVSIRLLAGMSIILRRLVSQVEVLALKDASARLAQFLLEGHSAGTVNLTAPKAMIASHLGMTPETLSRLFFKLEGLGVLSVNGRRIKIDDSQALGEIAAGERDF